HWLTLLITYTTLFRSASYGNDFWWGEDPETPSAGGKFVCGELAVGDLRETDPTTRFRVFPLEVEIPPGWRTQDPNDLTSEIPLEDRKSTRLNSSHQIN